MGFHRIFVRPRRSPLALVRHVQFGENTLQNGDVQLMVVLKPAMWEAAKPGWIDGLFLLSAGDWDGVVVRSSVGFPMSELPNCTAIAFPR